MLLAIAYIKYIKLTVGLHINEQQTNFILFNYHRRDRNGLLDANGAAVLLHFGSFDELVLFIFLMKVIPTN